MTDARRSIAALCAGFAAFSISLAAQRPTAPVRDIPTREQQPVSASGIRGRVVDIASSRPLSKARVTLSSDSGEAPAPVVTDTDGSFGFAPLPAGHYTLIAEKTGYARVRFGAQTELDPPIEIEVAAGAASQDVLVRLTKGAAIFGRVTDEFGDPIVGAEISVGAIQAVGDALRLVPVARPIAETNDLGHYRIGDLPPGRYFVSVAAAGLGTLASGTPREWERLSAWGRTFYPGVRGTGEAMPITLAPGEERGAVDFPVRSYDRVQLRLSVTGVAPMSAGPSNTPQVQFWFFSGDDDDSGLNGRAIGISGFGAGGVTTIPLVNFGIQDPGDWTVLARSGGTEAGIEHFHLSGGDDRTIDINLGRASTVGGRVLFAGTSQVPSPTAVQLSVRGAGPDVKIPGRFLLPNPVSPKADGTFQLTNLVGTLELVTTAPSGWIVQSVTHDGHDLLEDPLALKPGEDVSGLQIVLTDKVGSVTGRVLLPDQAPASGCTVAIFPDEPTARFTSRRMRLTRADARGQFSIRDLPGGLYRIAAAYNIDAASWLTQESIDRLRPGSSPFAVGDRAQLAVTLSCSVGQ